MDNRTFYHRLKWEKEINKILLEKKGEKDIEISTQTSAASVKIH